MPDISKFSYGGNEYNFKDAQAREDIAELKQVKHWLGITTTELTDGASTNPITIEGESVTAEAGSWCGCATNNKEFVFNGTVWQELGDLSDLGALAYKDDASATYTPAGSINVQTATVTPTLASVEGLANAGTLPGFSVSNEILSFDAGTLPTKALAVSVFTGATVAIDPATFTGSETTITVS